MKKKGEQRYKASPKIKKKNMWAGKPRAGIYKNSILFSLMMASLYSLYMGNPNTWNPPRIIPNSQPHQPPAFAKKIMNSQLGIPKTMKGSLEGKFLT